MQGRGPVLLGPPTILGGPRSPTRRATPASRRIRREERGRIGVRVARRCHGGPRGAEGYEHGGWAFQFDRGEEGDRFKLDEVLRSDALLLGRVTYQAFAEAWPSRTDDSGFADKMNGMAKFCRLDDPSRR